AAFVGAVRFVDPKIKRHHTITLQGSLFKFPGYVRNMEDAVKEILGKDTAGKFHFEDMNDKIGLGISAAALRQRGKTMKVLKQAAAQVLIAILSGVYWYESLKGIAHHFGFGSPSVSPYALSAIPVWGIGMAIVAIVLVILHPWIQKYITKREIRE